MNRIQFQIIFLFFVLSSTLVLIPFSKILAAKGVQAEITFTTDLSKATDLDTFSAYDTIYALVQVSDLQPGLYKAVINWIAPDGAINQYKEISFSVQRQSTYTFYSWIRLLKNGPLKSTLSGKHFDEESIGQWELHLFINGKLLKRKSFNIYY